VRPQVRRPAAVLQCATQPLKLLKSRHPFAPPGIPFINEINGLDQISANARVSGRGFHSTPGGRPLGRRNPAALSALRLNALNRPNFASRGSGDNTVPPTWTAGAYALCRSASLTPY
jgi:hypothetical protein